MTKSGLSSLLPDSQLSSVRQLIAGTLTLMSARDSLATRGAYADVPLLERAQRRPRRCQRDEAPLL